MSDLLKIVRYSNLFDLNHIMDAIAKIHLETNTSSDINNENRNKNYRGRLSKKKTKKERILVFLLRIK
jgi:hypothetical protein